MGYVFTGEHQRRLQACRVQFNRLIGPILNQSIIFAVNLERHSLVTPRPAASKSQPAKAAGAVVLSDFGGLVWGLANG